MRTSDRPWYRESKRAWYVTINGKRVGAPEWDLKLALLDALGVDIITFANDAVRRVRKQ